MMPTKTKRRRLGILLAAGLLLVGPGCLQDAPDVPFTHLTAFNGLDAAQDAIQDNVEAPQLAYVQGYELKTSLEAAIPNDGYLEEWEIGYYFPLTQEWRIVRVSWDGVATTVDVPAHPEVGMTFQPIDPLLAIDSPEAIAIAAATLKKEAPSFEMGDELNYWLSHRDGKDVWQLTFRGKNATVVNLDAHTGEVVEPSDSEPISFHDALELAGDTLSPEESDVLLLGAGAREMEVGGASSLLAGYELFDGVFLPPDVEFADGASLVWAFVYHDPSARKTWPVWVYAGLLPIRGSELDKPASATDTILTNEAYVELPVVDSTDVAETYYVDGSRNPQSYILEPGGLKYPDTWRIGQEGDGPPDLFVDAHDGSCVSGFCES